MTTGQRIKEARKNAKMTQAELAGKLGVPYQSVSQWERDTRNPKYETLKKIADAIGVEWFTLVPPEESSRIVLEHTNAVISQEENRGKSYVKTWPPEPSFPNAQDKHMAGLMDSYYHGVVRWLEDKLFSEDESITIKMHFSELLLKYKQLIERTLYAKRAVAELVEAGMQRTIIQQHLTDELEKELKDLKGWIDTIPHYFSFAVTNSSNQSEDPVPPEEE